jgi:hypothetical protein
MVEAGVPGDPQKPFFDAVRGVDPADVPVGPENPRQTRKTSSLKAIMSSKSFPSSSVGITCPCSYGKTIYEPEYSILKKTMTQRSS